MKYHPFHAYPSTYLATAAFACAAFEAYPSLASFFVHFFILMPLLLVTLWLAHWEGRKA